MGGRYEHAVKRGERVGPVLSAEHAVADRLVLHKIRDIVGGPKNFFSAGGAYATTFVSGGSVSLTAMWEGRRPDRDATDFTVLVENPSYLRIDAALTLPPLALSLAPFVRATNLLGRDYVEASGFPAPKRRFLAGLVREGRAARSSIRPTSIEYPPEKVARFLLGCDHHRNRRRVGQQVLVQDRRPADHGRGEEVPATQRPGTDRRRGLPHVAATDPAERARQACRARGLQGSRLALACILLRPRSENGKSAGALSNRLWSFQQPHHGTTPRRRNIHPAPA